jgi:mitogen-activated protein kinase kinase
MSSPAPLLRPPIPGARNNGGARTPRLGLAIPPSPHAKPVVNGQTAPNADSQRAPPLLRLATPSGSNAIPQEGDKRRLPPLQMPGTNGSDVSEGNSRSGSFGDGANGAAFDFNGMLRQPGSAVGSVGSSAVGDDGGGVSMKRSNSINSILPDLDKLSLEKGRPLDVEDLDDLGWRAASKEGRIEEIGSLGEGAGGSVSRCILTGGKTVFALKVGPLHSGFK